MAQVQVQLLGKAKVRFGKRESQFLPDKRYQLLTYLAYQEDWVGREQLLYLFWSDSSSEHARDNLRQLLRRVRDLECASGLELKGQYLRWPVASDVHAFKQAVSTSQWSEALSHYTGPLLESLRGDESPEFLNWLDLERERLHDSWRMAVQRRAQELEAEGWYLEAATLLKTLVEGDDLDEEALKAYMGMMVKAGGRDGALKAYQAFALRLEAELELSPTTDLEQFANAIREGDPKVFVPKATPQSAKLPVPQPSPEKAHASLPTLGSAFVGRDLELAEVSELLAKKECRLLTLTGVGGVGKTRIAVQVAAQLSASYPDGLWFVSLEALDSPGLIPLAIADALKLRLGGADDALRQVIRYIAQKRLLFILDNFEHLLDGAPLASELIGQCPNVRLLVTSRESLNLSEEWHFPIGGLSYPEQDSVSLEESQYFDAVRLFVQRVKQVQPSFVLGQTDLPYVLQICQRLEGSALGLELAAVWAKSLPLADIAQEIGSNLDFLASSSRNPSKRHQSIRAVFEHSWQLLTAKEQEVLRKLSVFVGGFSKEAAKQVADASLPILAALVDKSLLRVSPTGRYDRHALVYQYSQEKLALHPKEKQQSEAKHGAYFLGLVREQAALSHTAKRKTARQILADDYSNIRSSWQWGVAQTRLDIIKRSALALSDFFEGHRYDGLETFAHTATLLDETNPEHQAALAYVLLGQVSQQRALSYNPQKTKALAERAIALLTPLGDDQGLARGLWELADDEAAVGNFARAQALLLDALALARRAGEPSLIGHVLCTLARVHRETSPFAEAKGFMEAALSELSDLGNTNHQAYLLLFYGAYLVYQNHLDEGEARLNESLRLSDELGGGQDFRTYILLELAGAAYKRADLERAERLLGEAQREAKHRYHKSSEATALFMLGRVKVAQRAFAEAGSHFIESLRMASKEEHGLVISAALVYLAELEAAQGQAARAVELLTLIQGQDTVEKRDRAEAEQLLANLSKQLSPKDFAKARARAGTLTVREVVAQVLGGSYTRVVTKET